MATQSLTVQIASIGSNTEKLDRNHLERGTNVPIDSNFQLASLHFRYCEMHAKLSVVLSDSLF